MIRVLQIGLSHNPGGVENCIINYYRFLNRSEFSFDFADIYGCGLAYSEEIMRLGGKIHILSNFKKAPFKMAAQLRDILRQNRYDIVHINMLSAANLIPVYISCRSQNKPAVIVHSHNAGTPSGKIRNTLHKVNVMKLRKFPVEKWACSISAGKWMWGESFDFSDVIPNAIDITRFQHNTIARTRLREECGFQEANIIIGFVGRLCEEKNVLFFPEILMELKKLSPEYKMLIIGDGVQMRALVEKFNRFRLSQDVYFAGSHNDVSQWFSAMDALILPSIFEGLGLVGVEAQANGLPCFVSDRVPNELDLTGAVTYLPIQNGATVWAEAIHNILRNLPVKRNKFPDEYQLDHAVKHLEKRYLLLNNKRYTYQ